MTLAMQQPTAPSVTTSITATPTDAERNAVSRRLRKFHAPAVRHRYRLIAISVWLLTVVGFYFFFSNFDAVLQFMRDACTDHLQSLIAEVDLGEEADYGDWLLTQCLAESAQARSTLRNAILCLLGIGLLYVVYLTYVEASRMRVLFHPLSGRTFRYTIAPEGFTVEEPHMTTSIYHWRAVERIERDGDMLLFFIDKCAAHFINLRHFANEAEAEQFLTQARVWKAAADAAG